MHARWREANWRNDSCDRSCERRLRLVENWLLSWVGRMVYNSLELVPSQPRNMLRSHPVTLALISDRMLEMKNLHSGLHLCGPYFYWRTCWSMAPC